MSELLIDDVKRDLRVTHSLDDAIIQQYINASEREALQFMERDDFDGLMDSSSSSGTMFDDVAIAIFMLVRSKYEAQPADVSAMRAAAESLLFPYRQNIGV